MPTVLDTNVPITDNTPTFPDTPAGFDVVSLFAYHELDAITASSDLSTTEITSFHLAREGAGAWNEAVNQIKAQYAAQGQTVLAYGVYEQPVENISVPTQFCVAGQCFDVPGQVCLPFIGCLPVAGQTLQSGYVYRLWMLTENGPAVASGYAGPFTLRGQVRGFLPILEAIGVAIIILTGVVGLAFTIGIVTGKLTPQQVVDQVKAVLRVPGENLQGPIQSVALPFVALGITIVAGALLIPNLNLSSGANVSLPGGSSVGGTLGVGAAPGRPGRR